MQLYEHNGDVVCIKDVKKRDYPVRHDFQSKNSKSHQSQASFYKRP